MRAPVSKIHRGLLGLDDAIIDRANVNATRSALNTFAFVTEIRVYNVDVAFFDCIIWALRKTEATSGAFVRYCHCHTKTTSILGPRSSERSLFSTTGSKQFPAKSFMNIYGPRRLIKGKNS